MAGRTLLPALAAAAAIAAPALAASGAGDLDKGFGTNGIAIAGDPDTSEHVEAGALDAKSRILVASRSKHQIVIDRLLPDGSPDPAFGEDGRSTLDFGEPDQVAKDVAADGAAVLTAGFTGFEGGDSDSYYRFQVNRLTPGGSLDASFGENGTAIAPFAAYDVANAVVADDRGRVVAAGRSSNRYAGPADLAVARFDRGGTLDKGFAGDGMWRGDLRQGAGRSDEWIEDIALDSHGRIVFAGAGGPVRGPSWMIVGRLRSDGRLDKRFGDDGIRRVFVSKHRASVGVALALDARDRILLTGPVQSSPGSRNNFGVARLTRDGSLDEGFSGDGRTTIALDGEPADLISAARGRVVVAGKAAHPTRHVPLMTAARLTRTGKLDRAFGDAGVRFVPIGEGPGQAAAVLGASQARYLLVGEAGPAGIGVAALKAR